MSSADITKRAIQIIETAMKNYKKDHIRFLKCVVRELFWDNALQTSIAEMGQSEYVSDSVIKHCEKSMFHMSEAFKAVIQTDCSEEELSNFADAFRWRVHTVEEKFKWRRRTVAHGIQFPAKRKRSTDDEPANAPTHKRSK